VSVASIASCENHPAREAIGVCVQCRTRVCSECATKVEGINYCVRCLTGLAAQGGRTLSVARTGSRLSVYVSGTLYVGLLSAGVWLLLQVMLPGG
jgi:hypothetical protein